MKKFLIILIILFICGILSADVCLKYLNESSVLLGKEFYEQFANAKLAFKDVFWNLFYERVKLFAIFMLICYTPIKEKIAFVLFPMFSFIWGFYIMSCMIEIGFAGMVVGLASLVPHGLFYGVIFVTVLNQRNTKSYYTRKKIAPNIALYLLLFLTFLTGCILETLVSVHFVPWVIRLSLI